MIADGERAPGDLAQVAAGARHAAILEITLDDRHPLMTAVLPDHDGGDAGPLGKPARPQ